MDNNNENQLYMQGITCLPHVDVTCPNCGQEMEVELPKGVVYAEDVNDSIARMKTIERNKESNKAKAYLNKIRHQIDIERQSSTIFNWKKKMDNIRDYVRIIEEDYEKY